MQVELHASTVTSGPSYDNVQMLEARLEDDEGLEFTVTGTRSFGHAYCLILIPSLYHCTCL